MATVQIRLGRLRSVDGDHLLVWSPLSDAEVISSDGTNKTTVLVVTDVHIYAVNDISQLVWRVVVSGTEAVKCARGSTPDAATASNDMVLGNTVEYFGVQAVGEKVAITNS